MLPLRLRNSSILIKCLWNKFFYYLIRKSFENDKEWRLFYCDSTLGSRVIQDFDLCKLDDLWRHDVDKMVYNHKKIESLSPLFLYRTETWYSCYTHHKVTWYVHYDISMATQWAPGPLISKGKIRVFLLQEMLFAIVVSGCEWIWTLHSTSTRKSVKLWSNK